MQSRMGPILRPKCVVKTCPIRGVSDMAYVDGRKELAAIGKQPGDGSTEFGTR